MKTIVFIITDITLNGGVERITTILANLFTQKGFRVTIISLFKSNDNLQYKVTQDVKILYATNDSYNLENKSRISNSILLIQAYGKLKTLLINNKFDIIISQCFLPSLLVYLQGLAKYSIVCDHFKYELYKYPLRKLRDYIYGKFKQVVVLTNKDYNKYREIISNVSLIPNVSPFKTSDTVANLSIKRMIAVGRLHPQKGFDLLLYSVKEVFEKYPDWSLDIFGEGYLNNQLIQQRDKFHLQNNVHFKGYTNDVRNEMLNSSIYILSSRYEGLPLVLLEALSCGLPIVSFNCPEGPEEILRDDSGILVEPENVEKMSEAIVRMIEHEELRQMYSLKGLAQSKKYSAENIYKKWDELFHRIF